MLTRSPLVLLLRCPSGKIAHVVARLNVHSGPEAHDVAEAVGGTALDAIRRSDHA